VADKSTQLILAALSRAAASPDGAALFAAKSGPACSHPPPRASRRPALQRRGLAAFLVPRSRRSRRPFAAAGDTAVLVAKKTKTARNCAC